MHEDVVRPLQCYRIEPSHVKLEKRIGEGAFGEVWVSSFRGNVVAVKRMKSHAITKREARKFREEALLSEFCGVKWLQAAVFQFLTSPRPSRWLVGMNAPQWHACN